MIYILKNDKHIIAVVDGPTGFDMHADIIEWVYGICQPRPVVTEHQGKNTPGYRKQKKKLDAWLKMRKEHCSVGTYLNRLKSLGFKILEFNEVDNDSLGT